MTITMPALLPCPFCGADASMTWVMDEKWGKSVRVECSRDGECPSPSWQEATSDAEHDADCVAGVARFWNTRATDWDATALFDARVRISQLSAELACVRRERDRAMQACEAIAATEPPHD